MNKKPVVDFIIVGAQKCATTSLFLLLKQHPQLIACKTKEPGYFLNHGHNGLSRLSLIEYEKLFDKEEFQYAFEATPAYTRKLNNEVLERIYEYNPNMKIIYMVRNPIARIVSAHHFSYTRKFISKRIKNINDAISNGRYVDETKYYSQISPYIDKFGSDSVKILFFEDFKNNQSKVVSEVCSFLKIPFFSELKGYHANKTERDKIPPIYMEKRVVRLFIRIVRFFSPKYANRIHYLLFGRRIDKSDLIISEENRQKLNTTLLPEIINLEKLTGRDLGLWKSTLLSNN